MEVNFPEAFPNEFRIEIAAGGGKIRFASTPDSLGWNDEKDRSQYGQPSDPVNSGTPIIDVMDEFIGEFKIGDLTMEILRPTNLSATFLQIFSNVGMEGAKFKKGKT